MADKVFVRRISALTLFWCAVVAAVSFIVREANKVETPPFWFNDSQLGWEMKHYKVPEGADAISDAIIHTNGIRYLPWKRESRIVTFIGDANLRTQWEGDRMLARYVGGEASFFGGGGKLHPPLTADPFEAKKTLRECLSLDDGGKISKAFAPGPSVGDLLGAKRPKD